MFHSDIRKFPTVNISKLNFWSVIWIAKNFIWTILKGIFSIFRFLLHPQSLNFQIVVSQPILSYTSTESLFIQLSDYVYILIKKIGPYDWFCGPESQIIFSYQNVRVINLSRTCLCIAVTYLKIRLTCSEINHNHFIWAIESLTHLAKSVKSLRCLTALLTALAGCAPFWKRTREEQQSFGIFQLMPPEWTQTPC